MDDYNGSDFESFGEDSLSPAAFTLHFEAKGNIVGAFETLSQYEIQGQLQVRPVTVDRCQGQVNGVNPAQAVVNGIEAEIRNLQDQLRGGGDEPPLPKAFIIAEIRRIRTEELAPAVAALEAARSALNTCCSMLSTNADPQPGGVASA